MGRQNVIVVVGIILMAINGLASAASSPSPSVSPSKAPVASKTEVETPVNEDTIGTTDNDAAPAPSDDGDVAVAGPIRSDSYGSEGPSGSEADSGTTAIGVSAIVVAVASVAGSFLFF